MTSSDREILISITEILTKHIEQQNEINTILLRNQAEMRAGIRQLHDDNIRITDRLNAIELYGGLILGAITLMVTVSTVIVPLVTAMFSRRDNSQIQTPPPASVPSQQPVFYVLPSEIRPYQPKAGD